MAIVASDATHTAPSMVARAPKRPTQRETNGEAARMPSALTAVIMPMMSVPTPRWCRVKAVSGMVAPRPRPTTPMLTTRAKKSRHGMCFMAAPAG